MNLDKLKELERKATPVEWEATPEKDSETTSTIFNNPVTRHVSDSVFNEDAELICALRNSAKEMIETIERYGAALEEISVMDGVDFEHGETSNGAEEIAAEALKDTKEETNESDA